ncbi:MAG: 3-oxoacyl-ACP reductase FabG [Cyclobacteriaceae bacterium]|nr:3-oxoacyl-ACP reductase FabG [Cyclobacteriaceae bacterium]
MKYIHDINLKGKVALVTGAARGIGRACCLAMAEVGADIAVGLRDIDKDSGLIDELNELGVNVLPVQMDVSDKKQIDEAVAQIISHFGRIDILVNNAGIAPDNLIENYTEEDFDKTIAVNLKGTFFTSQAVGKQMIEQNSGRIINLSSQAGFIALAEESVYCMTKAGISHLTKCFAAEWAKYNINVNAVAPTFIETPGTEPWLNKPEFKKDVLSKILLNKVGQPIDVASAVAYLASPAGDMITGSTMMIDGGWTIV